MNGAVSTGQRAGAKPRAAGRGRAAPGGKAVAAPWQAADDLFCDGKDAGALRTIGEVARALGLRQHVLRYWEEQFPMLRPLTRAGGRRYYRPEDIALLGEIDRLLHREGYTIRGARQAMGKPAGRRGAAPSHRDTSAPLFDGMADHSAIDLPDLPVPVPLLSDAGEAELAPELAPELAMVSALAVLRTHLEAIRARLAEAISQDCLFE